MDVSYDDIDHSSESENESVAPRITGAKRRLSAEDLKQYTTTDGEVVARKRTTVERESSKRRAAATEVVSHMPAVELPSVEAYIPQTLSGAIFCGHLVTDLDSIAGAIGAAELYGGIPARASEVNSETAFALKHWGVEKPRPIEELLVENPTAGVCLVDHQQTSQLNPAIDVSSMALHIIYFVCILIEFLVNLRSLALLVSSITMLSKTPLSLRTCLFTSIFVLGAPCLPLSLTAL